MKKLFTMTLATLALTACVGTELSTQGKAYNPAEDARVRVFGQNGRPALMEINHKGQKEKVTVGGGLGQAFSSMVGAKGNESIGMPETAFSKDPSGQSRLLSGIFFKEFVVPAGSEVTVNNQIQPVTNTGTGYENRADGLYKITTTITTKSCQGDNVTFVAEAGKNYEVAPIASGTCGVSVYEIK